MIPIKDDRRAVERFSAIYSNCGYFGIPVINSVYGSEGVFYLSASMAIFQIFSWTHGLAIMRGKSDEKIPLSGYLKSFISPAMIAPFIGVLFFLCRITFPELLTNSLNAVGSMNTPLAMIIAGLTLAQSNFKQVFLQVRVYYVALIKLIILPALMMLALMPFNFDPMVASVTVLVCGCPSAVLTVLFAVRFDRAAVYASEIFTATTVLCAATLPIVMYFCQLLL